MVIELEQMIEELKVLEADFPGISKRFMVDVETFIVLPYHKEEDGLLESMRKNPIGTTKRGIGPAYQDKAARQNVRIIDLFDDELLREAIVKKYAGLVRYAANRIKISFKNTRDIEFCDLEGYGSIGLLEAIERYNPSKNIKFKSFALWRIHGSIIDALRDLDILPRSIRQKLKKIETFTRFK